MPNVNFGTFATITSLRNNDFLVGYRNASETKTSISALTALSIPYASAYTTLRSNSARYESTYNNLNTSISPNTALWNSTYTTVSSFSGFWGIQPNLSSIIAASGNWNEAYYQSVPYVATLRNQMSGISVVSGAWNSTYSNVYQNSAAWNNAVSAVLTLSANALYVAALTGNWNATYTYVQQNSGIINYTVNYVSLSSSNWDYAYNRLQLGKDSWDSTATTVGAYSAVWNNASVDSLLKTGGVVTGAITTTQTNTAAFTLNEFISRRYVDAMALATTISGNFVPSLYYNKIETDAKLLPLQADLSNIKPITGTWNSAYNTVNTISAGLLTTSSARSIFVALTGGSINGNLTIQGGLSVLGDITYVDTVVTITSALSVTNTGTGPALSIKQTGDQPVAIFRDDNYVALYVEGSNTAPGHIGMGTAQPNEELTVVGSISASQSVFASQLSASRINIGGVIQDRWNSTYNTLQAISAKTVFLESNIIEVNNDLTIDNTNCEFYTNKILHLSSNNTEITLTFVPTISGTFTVSMINLGTQDVLIEPDDNTYIKSASYTIFGDQFSTATIYKYNNRLFLIGTAVPA